MSEKIKVVGMTADSAGALLFLANGSTKRISTNYFRIREIIDYLAPLLAKRMVVDLELSDYSMTGAIEKRSAGVVKFFKRLKAAIVGGSEPVNYGVINHPEDLAADETMVAIVGGKEIPGVERMAQHMKHAAYKDAVGFTRFMERLAAVIDQRGHSVDELLGFMQRSELPLADDGSIIAYKRLCHSDRDGWFVDCHTRNVFQRPGMIVAMDENLVDPSRRTLCSTGLHIARRSYLSCYSRSEPVCLAKIAPEDVIAVPENEQDKMRVSKYELLAQLPDEVLHLIDSNMDITVNQKASALLTTAIKGGFPAPKATVWIGGKSGTNLTYSGDEAFNPENDNVPPVREAEVKLHKPEARSMDVMAEETKLDVETVREKAVSSIAEAAMTGNMGAAISEPKATKAVKPKPAANLDQKPAEKPVERDPVRPAVGALPDDENALSDSYKAALTAIRQAGATKRGVERETGVSARSIGRLLAKYGK